MLCIVLDGAIGWLSSGMVMSSEWMMVWLIVPVLLLLGGCYVCSFGDCSWFSSLLVGSVVLRVVMVFDSMLKLFLVAVIFVLKCLGVRCMGMVMCVMMCCIC